MIAVSRRLRRLDRATRFAFTRAVFRIPGNLLQSFVLPVGLLVILVNAVDSAWNSAMSHPGSIRSLFLASRIEEFYAAVLLLMTTLLAAQDASGAATQYVASGRRSNGRDLRWIATRVFGPEVFAVVVLPAVSFMGLAAILVGTSWPWAVPAFWVLVIGLFVLAVTAGVTIGLVAGDSRVADLVITLLVYGAALVAGAYFPYPDSAGIWVLAHFNPFTHLLTRLLGFVTGGQTAIGPPELFVWGAALTLAGAALLLLRQLYNHGRRVERGALQTVRPATRLRRIVDRPGVWLTALAAATLPATIWLAAPQGFTPALTPGTLGIMYPYGGLATVALLLLAAYRASPLAEGPVHVTGSHAVRLWLLWSRGRLGLGAIVISTALAWATWRMPVPDIAYSAIALAMFFVWSLALMLVLARLSAGSTTYWAVVTVMALLVLLCGGSLWNPAELGRVGHLASFVLPNGLLLHHRSWPAVAVVCAQIGLMVAVGGGRPGFRATRALPRTEEAVCPDLRSTMRVGETSPGGHGSEKLIEMLTLRERKRILDEVHDTLGHGITGALWQIRSARAIAEDEHVQEILARAAEGLERGLARIRSYLRDSAPRPTSDWSELQASVTRFTSCPVNLTLPGDAGEIGPDSVRRFATAVEELLTNAIR